MSALTLPRDVAEEIPDVTEPHVALIARKSPGDDNESVPSQIHNGHAYVARIPELAESGLPVVVYADDQASGYDPNAKRPRFQAAKRAIAAGLVPYVVCRDQSRILRHGWDAFLDFCRASGTREVHQYHGAKVDTAKPSDRVLSGVHGLFDRYYVEVVKMNVAERFEARREAGLPASGTPPFGYVWTILPGNRRTYAEHPEQAAILRHAAGRILDGATAVEVAAELTAAGTAWGAKEFGGAWTGALVHKRLSRPQIAGFVTETLANDRAVAAEIGDGTWPAILSVADFRAVNARLGPKAKRGKPNRYLLSGILRCQTCDRPMSGSTRRADGRESIGYVCKRTPKGGCGQSISRARWIEDEVAEFVQTLAMDDRLAAMLANDAYADERAEAEARLTAAEARRDRYAAEAADGELDEDEWRVMRPRLRDALAAAREAFDAIPPAPNAGGVDVFALARNWPNLSDEDRRIVIRALLADVSIAPASRGQRSGRAFEPERLHIVPIGAEGDG